jgi:CTP:phosphocholine cytidylyltransferase-like protein/thiamine kinase-like enzyme
MNATLADILLARVDKPGCPLREVARTCGISLGKASEGAKQLEAAGWLGKDGAPTGKTREQVAACSPKRAIILASGAGLRMLPVNLDTPKGLIKMRSEVLIERLIRQLHEAGITEIQVVVGYLKERYEYLMDAYGVELVVNPGYAQTGNIHALALVASKLANAYILPCDVWCEHNPFSAHELYAWYLLSTEPDDASPLRANRKRELCAPTARYGGMTMSGIGYLTPQAAAWLAGELAKLRRSRRMDWMSWDDLLPEAEPGLIASKTVGERDFVAIDTLEQLRAADASSIQLQEGVMDLLARFFGVPAAEIRDVQVLKRGMTNRSFLFTCQGQRYIMRIPGEGTGELINRHEEAAVYAAIEPLGVSEQVLLFDADTGYKISAYLADARACDPLDAGDVRRSMRALKALHASGVTVAHYFDVFERIGYYESLRKGLPSAYADYEATKASVLALQPFIEAHAGPPVLCHIDACYDNVLFTTDAAGNELIKLIDWEYAGMADAPIDVAMWAVYAMYAPEQVEMLIDAYYEGAATALERARVHAYIAACGLLWSNWCEYKHQLGVEFGQYSLAQYRFAKEYHKIAAADIEQLAHQTQEEQ